LKEAQYPKDFLWGAATASHQIDGGNIHSDWWRFEHLDHRIKNGDQSGRACNSWELWEEDIKLMKELGLNSYRFSVEWAKVEPKENHFDEAVLSWYQNFVQRLLENQITPMITFHHFTLPTWVADLGGFLSTRFAEYFVRYIDRVFRCLPKDCAHFITFNESKVLLGGGYLVGVIPPEKSSFFRYLQAKNNLINAHECAYKHLHQIAKSEKRKLHVGLAHHVRRIHALNPSNLFMRFLAKILDFEFNDHHTYRYSQDFFGLNYYTKECLTLSWNGLKPKLSVIPKPGTATTDLPWEIYPEGLFEAIKHIAARMPDLPIYITENGCADEADRVRGQYIRNHLAQIDRAFRMNLPVKGYFHWTLMDNFEWIEGYSAKFGLYQTDFVTFKRTPRASAYVYQTEILARNSHLVGHP